ncbi:MAG: hypothetical protein JW849_03275 [Phycisphaerae bacterium]|nr:hypothetical protein [Phycisphaerae bacterium]
MKSRKIRVRKRDGSIEEFNAAKLAGVLRRVLDRLEGVRTDADNLAGGMYLYLQRTRRTIVTSAAVFGMLVKILRRIQLGDAAELFELHRTLRMVRRRLLRVRHDNGCTTRWDKSWLAVLAERTWHVSRPTARILAGEIELCILPQEEAEIARGAILDLLNEQVSQWGLAEPVPLARIAARVSEE